MTVEKNSSLRTVDFSVINTRLKKIKNTSMIVSLVNSHISIGMWLTFSFLVAGKLNLGKIGNYRLSAILETVAAFCTCASFLVMLRIFSLNRELEAVNVEEEISNLEKKNKIIKDELEKNKTKFIKFILMEALDYINKRKKQHKDSQIETKKEIAIRKATDYLDIAAISILLVAQVSIPFSLWFDLGLVNLHKKMGLAFDLQTIVDTTGLSLLFASLCIKSCTRIVNRSKKEMRSFKDDVLFLSSVGLPMIGFSLMFAGKILLGLEANNTIKFPITDNWI